MTKTTAARDAELEAAKVWISRQGEAQQIPPAQVEEALAGLLVYTPEYLIFREKRRARKTGRRSL